MATRQDLLDHLASIIQQAVQHHETNLSLGREIHAPLDGELKKAYLNGEELEMLIAELDQTTIAGLKISAAYYGGRDGDWGVCISKAAR